MAGGNRSALIDRAVQYYVKAQSSRNLRDRLKEEALANSQRDLEMAAEWFPLEEEAWQAAPVEKSRKK